MFGRSDLFPFDSRTVLNALRCVSSTSVKWGADSLCMDHKSTVVVSAEEANFSRVGELLFETLPLIVRDQSCFVGWRDQQPSKL